MYINEKSFCSFTVLALISLSIFLSAADILQVNRPGMFAPSRLGEVKLLHDGEDFSVVQDNRACDVKKYWADPLLRNVSQDKLIHF
jgi:hypothetical protein